MDAGNDVSLYNVKDYTYDYHFKQTQKMSLGSFVAATTIGGILAGGAAGVIGGSTKKNMKEDYNETITGSILNAASNVSINSGNDTNITGSEIYSNILTSINAGNDVNIKSAEAKLSSQSNTSKKSIANSSIRGLNDSAHHQTQINCTIQALRLNLRKDEELIVVLEPHLISRIKNNIEEYKSALLLADYSIVTKIFKSRESFMDDIDVVNLLNNEKILYIENYDDVVSTVKNIIYSSKDKKFVVLVMGAGNSYKIATKIKDECSKLKK